MSINKVDLEQAGFSYCHNIPGLPPSTFSLLLLLFLPDVSSKASHDIPVQASQRIVVSELWHTSVWCLDELMWIWCFRASKPCGLDKWLMDSSRLLHTRQVTWVWMPQPLRFTKAIRRPHLILRRMMENLVGMYYQIPSTKGSLWHLALITVVNAPRPFLVPPCSLCSSIVSPIVKEYVYILFAIKEVFPEGYGSFWLFGKEWPLFYISLLDPLKEDGITRS